MFHDLWRKIVGPKTRTRGGKTRRPGLLGMEVLEARTVPALYTGPSADWMGQLPGSVTLNQMSIPGTHDTMTAVISDPLELAIGARTQSDSLTDQLNHGIRFLDIRLGPTFTFSGGSAHLVTNDFGVYHGTLPLGLSFVRDVLAPCRDFLAAHPGETIVMSIKNDYPGNDLIPSLSNDQFDSMFHTIWQNTQNLWYVGNAVPNLDEVRGKVVLFRRFTAGENDTAPPGIDAHSWPDNQTFTDTGALQFANGATGDLHVQDQYNPGDLNTKVGAIHDMVQNALDSTTRDPDHDWYVNFMSAAWTFGGWLPSQWAHGVDGNPGIDEIFATDFAQMHSGRLGTMVMDYPQANLIQGVIGENWPLVGVSSPSVPYGGTATVTIHALEANQSVGFGTDPHIATTSGGSQHTYVHNGVIYTDYTATLTATGLGTTAIHTLIGGQPIAAPDPTVTVVADDTKVSITSSGPSVYGQTVTFTATVKNASVADLVPTGRVQFVIDGHDFGQSVLLVNGLAKIDVTGLSAGSHSITAYYKSDSNHFSSSDSVTNPLTQTVARAVLTVTANNVSKVYGSANPVFTATITGFVNGDTAAVVHGSPALTTIATAASEVGSYRITAAQGTLTATNYNFAFRQGKLSITPAPLTVTVDSLAKVYGQDVSATLSGTIEGIQNGDPITARYVSTGAGAAASPGTYSIDAILSDGGTGKLARDYTVTVLSSILTVNLDTTTTQLATSLSPSPYGRLVTFTAAVTADLPGGGTPTGTVTFLDGTTVLGTVAIGNGIATFTTASLSPGAHTITARYGGESNFFASTSAAVTQTVLSARDQIVTLIGDVNDLVASGVLGHGKGVALKAKLKAAIASLDRGNTNAAVRQLHAFIGQVQALVRSKKLTATDAQPLFDGAEQAIDSSLA